jgi:hypothetical protein
MIHAKGTTSGTPAIVKPKVDEYEYSPNGHPVLLPNCSTMRAYVKVISK